MPKVVTQRCLEQDLNPRPTDQKPKCQLLVAPPRHHYYALLGRFAIGARVALLWQHYGNAWQSLAVIRHAHRTPHACRTRILRMPAKTPLAGDNIEAPVPFRPYCGGVVTRTRNVSEYMLVLAVCLVLRMCSRLGDSFNGSYSSSCENYQWLQITMQLKSLFT